MFSEKDLVARSKEDMTREVEELLADAKRLKEEHDAALQKEMELRAKSVETRQAMPRWRRSSGRRRKSCGTAPRRCCGFLWKRGCGQPRCSTASIFTTRSNPWTIATRSGGRRQGREGAKKRLLFSLTSIHISISVPHPGTRYPSGSGRSLCTSDRP